MNEQHVLSRRIALQVFGAAGIGVALAACSGPGGTPGASRALGPIPPAAGKPKGTVSFAHWRAEDHDAFETLAAEFKSKYTDAKVIQNISATTDFEAQALQRLRGGASGDAFANFRGAQFTSFAKAGIFTDLTNSDTTKLYQPLLIGAGKFEGKQLGYPYQLVLPMPVMNEDAFDKAGADKAPTDWDGFLNTCDKLKSAGYIPMSWPGADSAGNSQLFNCMIPNNAPVDDMCAQIESGKLKCTDEWFVKMLKQCAEMAPFFQPHSEGTAPEPAQQLFASERAAMLVTGDYHIAAVRAQGAKFPVDMIFPITTDTGKNKFEGCYNATFIMGVNSASKTQPAAMAWIDFLSQPENAGKYANATIQHVTVKDVEYENADLRKTGTWLSKKMALSAKFQILNLDTLNAVTQTIRAVISGTSPEKAAEDAQKVVDQNL